MGQAVSRRGLLISGALGGAALAATASRLVQPAQATPTPDAVALPPHLFGPKPGIALLSRNENPYGPSPKVAAAVAEATSLGAYYADNSYLAAMIAEKNGIKPDQVALSTGSGEALSAMALAWGAKGTIVVPSLFWETTAVYAEKKGAKLKRIPLTAEWDIDLNAMEAAIDDGVSLVHICNPNNPTGKLLDPARLKAFCKRVSKKCTVVVDEAYNELTDEPAKNSIMDLVRAGDNVIVARTFSKIYGMAGMRIGYMMTTPENAKLVSSYVMSWMGAPQVAAAVSSYNDEPFLAYSKGKVKEAREMVFAAIKSAGLTHLPTETNFVYVKVPDAAVLQKKMAEKGIMIRGVYGDHTQWSRVSMGKIEDVKRYTAALKEIYQA
ncbi:MAG: aminotransferase class I/II-fold pyridoxal phosphate-dependent enzyme [Alphaproteobacteria bacterium]|nr:aminotransferase class I/II-fold pyridoxal phosphate-dependent enzyme [Alphaproteobacteria bacterium]